MQKTILTVYLKGRIKTYFKFFDCEIIDNVDEIINNLDRDLNDQSLTIIKLGQVAFKKDEFHHYTLTYK